MLSLLAVALAFLLHPNLNSQAQAILQYPFSSSASGDQTLCYEGVKASHAPDSEGVSSSATCFTVQGGKFTSVFTPSKTDSVTVLPGYAYPGLWDGHGHLLQYGEFLHSVDLFGSKSFDEVRSRVRDYVDTHPGAGGSEEWVRGVGWNQMALGEMPTAVCFPYIPSA
jgi:hypothetical protein